MRFNWFPFSVLKVVAEHGEKYVKHSKEYYSKLKEALLKICRDTTTKGRLRVDPQVWKVYLKFDFTWMTSYFE